MTEEVTNIVQIGEYKVDADVFAAQNKLAQDDLRLIADIESNLKDAKQNFKETVESMNIQTKIPKPVLAKYLKDRFDDSQPKDEGKVVGTKVVIDRGELYSVLNSTLDD